MPTLSKGSFTLNLGIIQLQGELSDEDRQCAWELYTEISTRVAVTGKQSDTDSNNFTGEIYIESLDSLYKFLIEARAIMRKFPVGKINRDNHQHLGIIINGAISQVLRPFLEKWQIKYRHWWHNESAPQLSPAERQSAFPELDDFLRDWASVRWLMRELQDELIQVYSLINIAVLTSRQRHVSHVI